jgi:predicted ATPase/transcriptional regulator with XRE-family HTH domain
VDKDRGTTHGQEGSFGARLRSLRESAGFSQEELAARAQISSHAVSALERGTRTRPYPHTIRALADALSATGDERAALIAAVPTRSKQTRGPGDAAQSGRSVALPIPATPLLGRDHEVSYVADLLRDPGRRLVTLTGTGGVGKTRLSLAVASAVAPVFANGVAFVELAPLMDADAVLPAIADAVGGGTSDDRDPASALAERLADQQVLLVLDNFEHLLGAAPHIAGLIEAAAGLTVLVSSRAPLRVRGETEVAVEPLALPPQELGSGADSGGSPAVQLFLDRARDVSPGWGRATHDSVSVAAICVRLAGIPLALELAAARARLLDPETLLARLDDASLDGARDLPARQRTMSAALDWSYGLLSPAEQALLRLLSVFAGGFRLDDLEAVAELSGMVRADDVLRLLHALSEQSLVVSESIPGRPARHRLLEPVAQYARGKLLAAGEWDRAARGHADHFLDLAELAAPQYQRAEQVDWLARIDAEHANLTAGLERCLAADEAEKAARFGWSLWLFWWLRGHLIHGRRHMEAVLDRPLADGVRARAELAAATMAFAADDIASSRDWWTAAEGHAGAGDDQLSLANAVAGLGLADLASGDVAAAERSFLRAAPIAEAAGEAGEWTAALNQIWLGTVALLTGDPDRAVEHIERGLDSARRRGDRLSMYVAMYNLSQVKSTRGRHAQARAHLAEGMRMSLETGDHANLAYFLDALAVVEAAEGTLSRVPILVGAAQGIRETIGARGYGYYRPDPDAGARAVDEARLHLGRDRYDDALDVGRAMPPDAAVRLALGERTPDV